MSQPVLNNREPNSPSVPKEVVVHTRAVLLSTKHGVLLRDFRKDYYKLVGSVFPWKQNGYPSAVAMLQAMPEAVRFDPRPSEPECRLYGIGSRDMFMPSWVIKAQGLPTPGSRTGSNHRSSTPVVTSSRTRNNYRSSTPVPNSSRTRNNCRSATPVLTSSKRIRQRCHSSCEEKVRSSAPLLKEPPLVYNARGLVSLYISWGNKQSPTDAMKVDLKDHLGRVHSPKEMVYTHGVAFARYSNIAQAREVIMRCHKTECHGTVIDVKPATDRTHTPKHQKESGNKTSSKPRSLMRSNTRFSQGRRELPGMGVEERTRGVSRTDDQRTLWRDGRLLMYMSDDDDTEVGFSPAGSETSHDDITMDQLVLLDDEMSGPVSTPAKLSVLMAERQANGLRMDPKETGLKAEHKDNGWSAKCLGLRGKLQETPNGRATATTVQPGSLHGRDFLSLTSLSSNSDSGRSKNVDQANGCRDRESSSRGPLHPPQELISDSYLERDESLLSPRPDTPDSLDDFEWDWSLLPPRSPVAAVGSLACQANIDRPLSPSTVTSGSAKPSVSATSPVSTADEAFEFGSSSNDVTMTRSALGYSGTSDDNDDDDFWRDPDREEEEERVVSGSYFTCGSCHHNSSSTPDCTLDTRLVCGVISKIEDPDNMWVQLGSDPGGVIEEMSVKMYEARPPRLQQIGLGTVCCLLLPSPLQKEKKHLIRRALIKENTQKHVMEPQVGVILVDVGTVFQFAVRHLRELPECVGVTIYPPLASPLALRGVASSYYDGDQWYSLDVDTIRQLLKNKKVYMLPWGSNGEPVLRSKCGHRLVTMFLDPHGEESVADKLIEDCHFVVRFLPNHAKMPVPSIDMAPPVSFQQSLTGIGKVRSSKDLPCTAVSHGVTEGRDRTDERGARGRRGGRRSMMGRLMKAVQDLEAAKLSSDPVT